MKKFLSIISGLSIVLLVAAIVIPSFMKSRETSCLNSCINNLRQIEAGKEQWALEQSKELGDPVNFLEVNSYIKGGQPICPQDGRYTYNTVGIDATCDYPDASHALP